MSPGIVLKEVLERKSWFTVSGRLPPPSCTGRPVSLLLLCCYISCYFHFTAQQWNSRSPLSRWAAFFFNMPTVRLLSPAGSQQKVDFLLLYFLTIYSKGNILCGIMTKDLFQPTILNHTFGQKEYLWNFISGLQKGHNWNQVTYIMVGHCLNPGW